MISEHHELMLANMKLCWQADALSPVFYVAQDQHLDPCNLHCKAIATWLDSATSSREIICELLVPG